MFTNTIVYAFRCQPRKQLYLIAFVDLVPVAKEKVSLMPVEYCLGSVEEYSECTIHKGEPEPQKGNVNTVYFINQASGKYSSQSHGVYLPMNACDCKWFNTYI